MWKEAVVWIVSAWLMGSAGLGAQEHGIDEVAFATEDSLTIKAGWAMPQIEKDKAPAVILIHQGGSDRSEWKGFFGELVNQGFAALAYDVRGHGKSDKVESIGTLFNDPNLAPRDLWAAIQFLKGQAAVDSARIGIVGASIGGNLACVGVAEMGVETAVFMSGKTAAAQNLAGIKDLQLQSMYYISSAGDQGGKRAQWAKELYEMTKGPRKVEIVAGSSAHGVHIFKDAPELQGRIIEWLKKTL